MRISFCELKKSYVSYVFCHAIDSECSYRSGKRWENKSELRIDEERPSDVVDLIYKPLVCSKDNHLVFRHSSVKLKGKKC